MSQVIEAVFENGGFRLIEPNEISFTEGQLVRLAVQSEQPSEDNTENTEEKFNRLYSKWKEEGLYLSSLSEMFALESYQEIVKLGHAAIPFILRELTQQPGFLIKALKDITGADPVSAANQGNVKAMVNDWLAWGRQQGYQC